MPRGQNPNSIKNLKKFKAGDPATKAAAKKAAKSTAAKKQAYRSLREMFRDRLTEEDAKEIYDMLYEMIVKRKNLKALDRYTAILGDASSNTAGQEASAGGRVIMMEGQYDGEK